MKKAERKKTSLLASLGDLNRPLRVRPVRYLGREWWAVDAEDTWPGMVMDLRRLGFEAVAMGDNVLVREQPMEYEPEMIDPQGLGGLKPFPAVHPKIRVRRESYTASDSDLVYLDEPDELNVNVDRDDDEDDEWMPEDLSEEEEE